MIKKRARKLETTGTTLKSEVIKTLISVRTHETIHSVQTSLNRDTKILAYRECLWIIKIWMCIPVISTQLVKVLNLWLIFIQTIQQYSVFGESSFPCKETCQQAELSLLGHTKFSNKIPNIHRKLKFLRESFIHNRKL